MTRSRRFFASSPWIATGTPDYVNLGYTSRGLAKQALMRLSRKSLAIFRKLGLGSVSIELYDLSDPTRLRVATADSFPMPPMPADPRPGCRGWTRADFGSPLTSRDLCI
jgi:hypothetical protein